MSRVPHVTPSNTAARIENLRTLVMALQGGEMLRTDIGSLLGMGPSGVRKYLADLAGKVKVRTVDGEQLCRLTMNADDTQVFLDDLALAAQARPKKPSTSLLAIAARDPSRHIHIMHDDIEFKPRMHRFSPARDPLVAALFGAGRMEARA